jgi:hypothetical protein
LPISNKKNKKRKYKWQEKINPKEIKRNENLFIDRRD